MKISHNPPKLYWLLRLFFPDYDFNEIHAFAFGDTIYTKDNPLADYHIVHERVHLEQMKYSKLYAIWHFLKFWFSTKFRYQTELEAYREQYRFMREKGYSIAGNDLANALSDKLIYGNVASYEQAYLDITA